MAEINKNLMRVLQVNQLVKAVTPRCETCGGPYSYNDCPATVGQTQNVYATGPDQAYQAPAYQAPGYQALVHQPLVPQPQVLTTNEFTNFMKANDAILKNMQTNMTSFTNSNLELKNMFGQFMKRNIASSSGLGTLSVECETDVTKDTVPPTNNESTKDVQPLVVQTETLILKFVPVVAPIIEPVVAPVSALKPNQKPLIPYPSRLHDQKLRDKANDQKEKFFQIFQDLNFNISFADALILMPKFGPTIKTLLVNKDKLYELAKTSLNEHCSAVLLKKFTENWGTPTGRALIDVFEGELTLRVGKESITFNLDQTSRYSSNYNDMTANRIDVIDMACGEYSQEVLDFYDVIAKVDVFLALEDDPTSSEVAKTDKSSIDEPPEVELKDLPPYLEYAFLVGDDKFPVIIANDLSDEEKIALIMVLKLHKRAIAWKLFDIKDINPKFYTHKILMEDDFKLAVQHQRRVNPKIYDVIKKEVLKLFDAGLIYPFSDSPWVNEATRKDHFPLPFMDQMLERLARNEYYCFLDGFLGYIQIPIDPKDQEKTTFTCPYGTFTCLRMPFCLYNAPGTFQRFMMAIFYDIIEKTMEVFMDDFSVFGNSFQTCLSHLEKMLKQCEDTNLYLNWEKSHFMVKEGIVLGHKIFKNGIEKAPAKVERSKGIDLLSDVTLLKEAQVKKALKRSQRETTIHQAGSSGDGTGSKPRVVDEPKGKSIDTSKGTGLKPGVPDADDVHTEMDDTKISDYEEETQDDEYIHTPEDYVPTNDETDNELKGKPEIISMMDVKVKHEDPKKEVQELRNVDNSTTVISTNKSEVPNAIKEFLGTNLDDALFKVVKKHDADIIKEFLVPQEIPKSTGKSAQVEETVFEAGDTQGPPNLKEDTGNTDEPPVVSVDLKDWFKKPKRPPTPDLKWNEGKSVENKPIDVFQKH
nr:DNA-directed DNA polymerase [Tanacetum cinerariifolium]